MSRRVHYSPESLSQLDALDDYLSALAGASGAASYLERLLDFCDDIANEPLAGHRRDDLTPGLLTRVFEKHRVVCFFVLDRDVHIIAIYGTRQNWEHDLKADPPATPRT